MVVPFDAQAAKIAAELWIKHRPPVNNTSYPGGRKKLKVDCQIVAIALAKRAETLYSHDPHIPELAKGEIWIQEVPEAREQSKLFDETLEPSPK